MDLYDDKRNLPNLQLLNVSTNDLLFNFSPCDNCSRNQFYENCVYTCRNAELWIELLNRVNKEDIKNG